MVWGKTDENRVGLLILCAKTWTQIGRCEFLTNGPVPKCLHGWFASDNKWIHVSSNKIYFFNFCILCFAIFRLGRSFYSYGRFAHMHFWIRVYHDPKIIMKNHSKDSRHWKFQSTILQSMDPVSRSVCCSHMHQEVEFLLSMSEVLFPLDLQCCNHPYQICSRIPKSHFQ